MSRPYLGPSESQSQANADVLERRGRTYAGDSSVSFSLQWDFERRQPRNLREAERMVRRAYSDEVPTALHEGPDNIGQDGTPRMTVRAEAYIFGRAEADDAGRDPETGQRDLVGYYYAPFRATVATLRNGGPERAAIVEHVAIGSQSGVEAAIREKVPAWCAHVVAEHVLRDFLRRLSDVKVHEPKREDAA